MSRKLFNLSLALCCFSAALSASDKCEKACKEACTSALCFDSGKKIKANKIYFNVQDGKNCKHTARYENGQIVTEIGGFAPFAASTSLNLGGEQTVYMYNYAGEVCFTSVSKDWEYHDKYIVHHHDGFDVHTKKKKQFVVTK
ncbi:MAG: hypothetical protein JSS60_05510 [Verrucomicrobia bacterium]|nr:hypothetical protein [Verrucomicrobiota bacterium]